MIVFKMAEKARKEYQPTEYERTGGLCVAVAIILALWVGSFIFGN